VAECLSCGLKWCDRCDPAPAASCHRCHGRGHTTAIIEDGTEERLQEAEETLAFIRRQIALFSVTCAHEEETDTDEVWQMLSNFYLSCGGKGLPAAFDGDDLDTLVHDTKSHEAADINNKGIRSQLEYLGETMGPECLVAWIEAR